MILFLYNIPHILLKQVVSQIIPIFVNLCQLVLVCNVSHSPLSPSLQITFYRKIHIKPRYNHSQAITRHGKISKWWFPAFLCSIIFGHPVRRKTSQESTRTKKWNVFKDNFTENDGLNEKWQPCVQLHPFCQLKQNNFWGGRGKVFQIRLRVRKKSW